MKIKEMLFILCSIVFVIFCIWYAVSEFGKSLDGWKPVQVEERNTKSGEIYIVKGRWMDGVLVRGGK